MSSDEIQGTEDADDVLPLPSTPTTPVAYSRTVSQNLRDLDDALTHAIDQLTTFNNETMSDLTLKYELVRKNESRVIGFFARQLRLLQVQKASGQNGGFHSEYSKLDRFLSVLNFNKKSINYIVQRITFDDLLNSKAPAREQLLYDADTTEAERKDFRNALSALKDCIDYFAHGGTNDNGRFFWHTEIPTTPSTRQHRLSDTALPPLTSAESPRSTSVSSSISTEFPPTATTMNNNNQMTVPTSPNPRRNNPSHTPPASRVNHLSVNGKGRSEHPSKKSSVDTSIFIMGTNSSRNIDLQLPNDGSSSRRSSYGSDSESRLPSVFEHQLENEILPYSQTLAARKVAISSFNFSSDSTTTTTKQANSDSASQIYVPNENKSPKSPLHKVFWNKSTYKEGAATPKSPTLRSPTMSGSPLGSAQNSDAEHDSRIPDAPAYNTPSPALRCRIAHDIQHKWSNLIKLSTCNVCSKKIFFLGTKCNICKFDRTRVFKFSFCDVCRKQVFRGKACLHCKYKCHKDCAPNAPPNCGLREADFRRAIENNDIQNALANSSPITRKYPYQPWDMNSPTPSTPISAPGSPAPHLQIHGYHINPSVGVIESIYSTQNDPDSWVVIETTTKPGQEAPESQSDGETTSSIPTDTPTNPTASTNKLVRQVSHSEPPPSHAKRDDLMKTKIFDINSFDDDESDPEKRIVNMAASIQDWAIELNKVKILEELPRSSGALKKAHWHGEIVVRMIQPDTKKSQVEFLNHFRTQVSRLRKVRHEHLNLYTGVCIESPHLAIASNWIRGISLFELIHIRGETVQLSVAVQYAAQIAQAMSYLHEKSICHKSLRTTNIFVQNTRIILTDYGLAPLSKCYRFTEHPAIIAPRGWLSYLAPEFIRKLDPRDESSLSQHTTQTDVYAFGTVWYELLFREFPYAKQPPEYIIWRAGNSLKQPLSSVHISKYAKDIIHQCWSFGPDDRPDFAMLCKSLSKMPGKRPLVRSPSTPLQHNARPHVEAQF